MKSIPWITIGIALAVTVLVINIANRATPGGKVAKAFGR